MPADPAESNRASSDEILGGTYMGDRFLLAPDGGSLLIKTNAGVASNGAAIIWDVDHGTGQDGANETFGWDLAHYSLGRSAYTPDGKSIVAIARVAGKNWLGLRDRQDMAKGQLLLPIGRALDLAKVIGFSTDGRGVFIVVNQRVGTSGSSETSPLLTDRNTIVMADPRYAHPIIEVPVTASTSDPHKPYPGAFGAYFRQYIVYVDLQTKETRRVMSASDLCYVALSPDRQQLLAVQQKPGQEYTPGVVENADKRFNDVYVVRIPALDQLPVIDLKQPDPAGASCGWFDSSKTPLQPVLTDTIDTGHWRWSPDGSQFSYVQRLERPTSARWEGDVWVCDVASGKTRNLTAATDRSKFPRRLTLGEREEFPRDTCLRATVAHTPAWARDSRAVLLAQEGYLWRLPSDGTAAENLSVDSNLPAMRAIVTGGPDHGEAANLGGNEVLVITSDEAHGRDGVAWFDLSSRQLTPLCEQVGFISQVEICPTRKAVYFAATSESSVDQVYQCSWQTQSSVSTRQLTQFQPELKDVLPPERQLISFVTKQGRHGWARLYLPAGSKDKKVPLVVTADDLPADHLPSLGAAYNTGNLGRWRTCGLRAVSPTADNFTSEGFAFLAFDLPLAAPGSYEPDLAERAAEAYDAATDAAIATGRIDPKKLGVWADGSSTGMGPNIALKVLCQRPRYLAAAMREGFGILEAQALGTAENAGSQAISNMAGDPTEQPDRYHAASAISSLGTLRTPVLFMHALSDPVVQPARTLELFEATQLVAVKSVAVFYNKGKRDLVSRDEYRRTIFWFNEHLRKGPVEAWHAKLPDTTIGEVRENSEAAPYDESELPPADLPDGSLILGFTQRLINLNSHVAGRPRP